MPQAGSNIYLQLPDHGETGTLHQGKVVSVEGGVINAMLDLRLEDNTPPLNAVLHHHDGTDFVRQAAKLQVLFTSRSGSGVNLTLLGQAVNAEKRQNPRTPTSRSESLVQLGDADGCRLLDVSLVGCAVASNRKHQVGEVVDVTLDCGGVQFMGKAEVRDRTDLRDGSFRYGLRCLNQADAENPLADGLRQQAVEAMREQFDRRAIDAPFTLPKGRPGR